MVTEGPQNRLFPDPLKRNQSTRPSSRSNPGGPSSRAGRPPKRGASPLDATRCYLDEIGRIPRLEPQEELRLASRLDRLRRSERRQLFATPHVIRLVLDALRAVDRGESEWKHLFEVPATRGSAARLLSRLPRLIQDLEDCVGRSGLEFRTLVRRSCSASDRRMLHQRLRHRCRATSRLLVELPWRPERLRELLGKYGDLAARLQELRSEHLRPATVPVLAGIRRSPRATRDYHLALLHAQEGYRSVQQRLTVLRRTASESDKVRAQLVEANLRLVVAIAKGYQRYGANLMDLVQDGNSGILRAAEKFDPNRGVPFGAYAGWWIRSSIRRAVPGHVCAIRLPEKSWLMLLRLRKSAAGLWHHLGRPPRPHEIAAAAGAAPLETSRLLALDAPRLSLDVAYADDETKWSASLQVESGDAAADDLDRRQLTHRVDRALEALDAQQRRVIELRFGLIDGQRRTLAEVGRVLDMSGEWARKLEARALDQLRQPACRARLEGFLD